MKIGGAIMKHGIHWFLVFIIFSIPLLISPFAFCERFEGTYYTGEGDGEYLELLDIARRMFGPDPEFQNLTMLYHPAWNGLVEGPTWDAWWIQNSYGPTYCALPFLEEPFVTFLQNSQDLWFDQMGDGKTVRSHREWDWIPPDGCLCDAARPGWFVAKQGDGRVDIHDWGMEFTAAGLLMQAELLLISRDENAIAHYLPKLERCANFIETRRDPNNNLFLAGPAGNLLAPSYAGYKKPDGTYDKAYLAGLSITTIAALDRLIELEKLAGNTEKVVLYTDRRDQAKQGLALLTTDEGYFIKSLDPDGTKHGVYGAEKHGYFEASPNHDAIAFRVVDDAQAEKIYAKIASLPGLRPHDFILPNYPGLDDMYVDADSSWLWSFGTWVNGGHWSTCEARMIMAYYRLGKYEDCRRSMKQLLKFAREFRMDNPLVEFGSKVYQPKELINLCYDSFGPPAALVRGLFEYLYTAEGLTIIPHIPAGITFLHQRFPIRFGDKKLLLAISGAGKITAVKVNGTPWKSFDEKSIRMPYDQVPNYADIAIYCDHAVPIEPDNDGMGDRIMSARYDMPVQITDLGEKAIRLNQFLANLLQANLSNRYETAHCELALLCYKTGRAHREKYNHTLPESARTAAAQLYTDTANKLYDGLADVIAAYENSDDPIKTKINKIWNDSK
jgi:hypothetical protein